MNLKQGFIRSDIIETDYLKDMLILKQKFYHEMPNEVKQMLKQSLINDLADTELGEIGILRLLPKVLKLVDPSVLSIDDLTSRGIKASLEDPVNSISAILAELSKTLFENLKREFKNRFGIDAPPKKGSDEAAKKLKNELLDEDDWKSTMELNGDFSDMYSNAEEQDVANA